MLQLYMYVIFKFKFHSTPDLLDYRTLFETDASFKYLVPVY